MSSDSADPFYWMRVILASNRGMSVVLLQQTSECSFDVSVRGPCAEFLLNTVVILFLLQLRNRIAYYKPSTLRYVISVMPLSALFYCHSFCSNLLTSFYDEADG